MSVHCSYCKGALDKEQRFVHESDCKHEEIERDRLLLRDQIHILSGDLQALHLVDDPSESPICMEASAISHMAKAVKMAAESGIIRMAPALKILKAMIEVAHESVGERLKELQQKVVKH